MRSPLRHLSVATLMIVLTSVMFVGTASTAFASSVSVTGITPITGHVGTSVVLTGTGFTGATDVQFTGVSTPVSATFTVNSDTQITAVAPDGALTGAITVTAPGGTAISKAKFRVQPTVSSFSPTSGPVGTSVVITGTAFTGATAVTFNKVPATSFSVDSYSQITATVPCCGASGRIKVTTPGGSGSSRTSFKVPPSITSFSPSSGPVGTTVVIVGVAFTGTKSVTFNGVAATSFTVDSDTQITVTVPTGATTGVIIVKTGGGAVRTATKFTVA